MRWRSIGFYVLAAVAFGVVVAVVKGQPHPWYVDLRLTLHWNVYETWGIASGLVYGALGSVWAGRRSVATLASVGLAFAAEPLIVYFLDRRGIWAGGELFRYGWLWAGEALLGLAAVTYALRLQR